MTNELYEQRLNEYKEKSIKEKTDIFTRIRNHTQLAEDCKNELQELLIGGDAKYICFDLANEFKTVLYKYLSKTMKTNEITEISNQLNVNAYINSIYRILNLSNFLDSEPMEFDGDIIITDPCYVVKNRTEQQNLNGKII